MKKKEEYNYFNEFILLTDYIVKSANILKEVIEKFNISEIENNIVKVHSLEHQADTIVHEMKDFLIKDFLPPIERKDISEIANKLDDLEDGIDEILINFKILNIVQMKQEVIEQVEVLVKCCDSVKDAFMNLKSFKNVELIKEKAIAISRFEEQGDRIYEKLMESLYKNETNAIELIKWTSIYNCLENTIDSCETLADEIQDIVTQNS